MGPSKASTASLRMKHRRGADAQGLKFLNAHNVLTVGDLAG